MRLSALAFAALGLLTASCGWFDSSKGTIDPDPQVTRLRVIDATQPSTATTVDVTSGGVVYTLPVLADSTNGYHTLARQNGDTYVATAKAGTTPVATGLQITMDAGDNGTMFLFNQATTIRSIYLPDDTTLEFAANVANVANVRFINLADSMANLQFLMGGIGYTVPYAGTALASQGYGAFTQLVNISTTGTYQVLSGTTVVGSFPAALIQNGHVYDIVARRGPAGGPKVKVAVIKTN